MIGILIVAHGTMGESLIECATHVLGKCPPALRALDVRAQAKSLILDQSRALVQELDDGDGVLLLSDIYGATPCNTMCRLLEPGRIEGVAGVNLPMLLRAITYRGLPFAQMLDKVITGGKEGVLYITTELCDATAGC